MEYFLKMPFYPLKDAVQNEDSATTVYFNHKKVCTHCWYSRKYKTDKNTEKRIDKILNEVIKEKNG